MTSSRRSTIYEHSCRSCHNPVTALEMKFIQARGNNLLNYTPLTAATSTPQNSKDGICAENRTKMTMHPERKGNLHIDEHSCRSYLNPATVLEMQSTQDRGNLINYIPCMGCSADRTNYKDGICAE